MVEHVYRARRSARRVDAVRRRDRRRAESRDAVDAFGGTAVMTSADHATGTDRLAEVAAALDGDLIVNVQGDEPLMTADGDRRGGRSRCSAQSAGRWARCASASTTPRPPRIPSVVKVVVDREGYALYFTRAPMPFVRPGHARAGACGGTWACTSIGATFLLELAALPQTPLERAEGLEQLRVLEHGFRIRTVETTVDTIGVDTPEDLERVRRLVRSRRATHEASPWHRPNDSDP